MITRMKTAPLSLIGVALSFGSLLHALPLAAADIPIASVKSKLDLSGVQIDSTNISGIAVRDDLLVLGSDELCSIQVFNKTETEDQWTSTADPIALGAPCEEIDIEGVAWGDKHLYVVGSHSLARKKVKPNKTVSKNQERLAKSPKNEASRKQVFRLGVRSDGTLEAGSVEQVSLDALFSSHPIFDAFREIPSKENGIDIEAIAVGSDELLIGFRGPILRGPFTPVLALTFAKKEFTTEAISATDRFLNLGGRGIRGMTEVPGGGYLVLAGPMGDAPVPYQLYFWNGQDALPGKDAPDAGNHVKPICRLTCPDVRRLEDDSIAVAGTDYVACNNSAAKAEGVEFVGIDGGEISFLVVYDTAPDGAPTLLSCPFET